MNGAVLSPHSWHSQARMFLRHSSPICLRALPFSPPEALTWKRDALLAINGLTIVHYKYYNTRSTARHSALCDALTKTDQSSAVA